MIRNDPELADWLWEQRDWSPWAESVALYYAAHDFMTVAQHETAVRMRAQHEAAMREQESK